MENLFYSYTEKTLFWVAGYTDNSNKIDEIVKMLEEKKQEFIKAGGEGDICTYSIEQSRRYKLMRVFYCTTDKIPENAFILGKPKTEEEWEKLGIPEHHRDPWTMNKWLHN